MKIPGSKFSEVVEHETISFVERNGEIREIISLPSDLFASKCHHLNGRSLHAHNCVEMFYILSGSCTHVLESGKNRSLQRLQAGNYFIMDNTVHHGFAELSSDFHILNLLFMPKLIDEKLTGDLSVEKILSSPDIKLSDIIKKEQLINRVLTDPNGKILHLFEKAWQIYKARDIGFRELARCYIIEILILSAKNIFQENPETARGEIVTYLCAYVNKHYAENVSLTDICTAKDLNISFVSRKFKETMGIGFETYLQQIRCQNACILLIETRLPIEKIGESVGYFEPGYFRKIFKRMLGISASAFRKYNK